MSNRVALLILDGWGITQDPTVSAISKANTPTFDKLWSEQAHSTLEASGEGVGLPAGQFGNSEVGHMNIGAGRVVYQDLQKINLAVKEGTLADTEGMKNVIKLAKQGKKLHFIGLVSDGGVHSHVYHLKGLLSIAHEAGLKDVFVHAFSDGRDCGPNTGLGFLKDVQDHMNNTTGKIASITGRYYAMDRDKRWEKTQLAYDAMVNGVGEASTDFEKSMQASYDKDVTDEFVMPLIMQENGAAVAKIEPGDVVVNFNYRTDRGRQISLALTQEEFPNQGMKPLDLHYTTMTIYDETYKGVDVIFRKANLVNTLGETLAAQGKKQIRIAESEKYPHVTFFFSGGEEQPFDGEKRILCPSPKVATYDLQPEMSAFEIKDKIVKELNDQWPDFVCLNFANPDMVGHTGVMSAAIKAVETVDTCLKDVVEAARANDYSVIIIADHGNSDIMKQKDGSPHTAHTTAVVPCIVIDDRVKEVKDGKLGDLAPTILKMMDLKVPAEMTGDLLVKL